MNEDHRVQLAMSRTGDYLGIMRTTLFVLLGIGVATQKHEQCGSHDPQVITGPAHRQLDSMVFVHLPSLSLVGPHPRTGKP